MYYQLPTPKPETSEQDSAVSNSRDGFPIGSLEPLPPHADPPPAELRILAPPANRISNDTALARPQKEILSSQIPESTVTSFPRLTHDSASIHENSGKPMISISATPPIQAAAPADNASPQKSVTDSTDTDALSSETVGQAISPQPNSQRGSKDDPIANSKLDDATSNPAAPTNSITGITQQNADQSTAAPNAGAANDTASDTNQAKPATTGADLNPQQTSNEGKNVVPTTAAQDMQETVGQTSAPSMETNNVAVGPGIPLWFWLLGLLPLLLLFGLWRWLSGDQRSQSQAHAKPTQPRGRFTKSSRFASRGDFTTGDDHSHDEDFDEFPTTEAPSFFSEESAKTIGDEGFKNAELSSRKSNEELNFDFSDDKTLEHNPTMTKPPTTPSEFVPEVSMASPDDLSLSEYGNVDGASDRTLHLPANFLRDDDDDSASVLDDELVAKPPGTVSQSDSIGKSAGSGEDPIEDELDFGDDPVDESPPLGAQRDTSNSAGSADVGPLASATDPTAPAVDPLETIADGMSSQENSKSSKTREAASFATIDDLDFSGYADSDFEEHQEVAESDESDSIPTHNDQEVVASNEQPEVDLFHTGADDSLPDTHDAEPEMIEPMTKVEFTRAVNDEQTVDSAFGFEDDLPHLDATEVFPETITDRAQDDDSKDVAVNVTKVVTELTAKDASEISDENAGATSADVSAAEQIKEEQAARDDVVDEVDDSDDANENFRFQDSQHAIPQTISADELGSYISLDDLEPEDSSFAALPDSINSREMELMDQLDAVRYEKAQLARSFQSAQLELKSLNRQQQLELEKLRAELEQASPNQPESDQLERLQQFEAVLTEKRELEQQIETARVAKQELQQQIESLLNQQQELQQQNESSLAEKQELQQQLEHAINEREQLSSQLALREEQAGSELEIATNQVAAMQPQLESLQQRLEEQEQHNQSLERQLVELQNARETANQQSTTQQQAYESLQEQLAAAQQELSTLSQQLETANQELTTFSQQLETANKALSTASQDLESTQQDLNSARQETEAVREKTEAARQEAEAARKEAITARQESVTTGQELETAQQELQTAQQELQAARKEIETTCQELETAQQQLDATRQELDNANREHATKLAPDVPDFPSTSLANLASDENLPAFVDHDSVTDDHEPISRSTKEKFTKLYRSYERERNLRKESEQFVVEAEKQRDLVRGTLKTLQQEWEARLKESASQATHAEAQLVELRGKVGDAESKIADLVGRVELLSGKADRVESLQIEFEELRTQHQHEIEAFQAELKEANQNLESTTDSVIRQTDIFEEEPATRKTTKYLAPMSRTEMAPPPTRIADPHAARADDLTRISGIGKVTSRKLNANGITTFSQIANWTETDVSKLEQQLNLKARIQREDWIGQAKEFLRTR